MLGSRFALPALAIAVICIAAVPISIALDDTSDDNLLSIEGTLKEFVCCSEDADDNETCDLSEVRAGAFILETDDGEDMIVKFGPWWYWETQNITVRDVVGVGDTVRVMGELADEEEMLTLEAWYIETVQGDPRVTGGDNIKLTGLDLDYRGAHVIFVHRGEKVCSFDLPTAFW